MAQDHTRVTATDKWIAGLLKNRTLMRLPVPLYRAGFGFLFGKRLVMIEHLGRSSGEQRFAVVECVDHRGPLVRVASGLGAHTQWYRNIAANGVAFISIGRLRRVPAEARLLSREESDAALREYGAAHPAAWKHLEAAMSYAAGGEADIRIIDFTLANRA
ncbi:MAG: nitroreductase family deazaflavin-dependent oxidoreductase [Pseudolysinimonas sp.]